jgi:hypothetical protein
VEQKSRASKRLIAPKEHHTKEVEDLSSMSTDELWALHQNIAATLVEKLTAATRPSWERRKRTQQRWLTARLEKLVGAISRVLNQPPKT